MTFTVGGMEVFVFTDRFLPILPSVSRFTTEDVVAKAAVRARSKQPIALVSDDPFPCVLPGIYRSRYLSQDGPFIPVGDAIGVQDAGVHFIFAPTKYGAVGAGPRNPYHAFKAALQLCQYMRAEQVFAKLMTGDPETSFKWMAQAVSDCSVRPLPRFFRHDGFLYTNASNVGDVLRENGIKAGGPLPPRNDVESRKPDQEDPGDAR